MATAAETLQATLSEREFGALKVLAATPEALSGRKVATALGVSPTTANAALSTLSDAGFVTATKSGRSTLWRLVVSHPSISAWLEEISSDNGGLVAGSSPYSTGGGGVRLEHSYAACLIAAFLAGEALQELGQAVSVDTIRLQASDVSTVDDIVLEGRDSQGTPCRSSIAVRRNPALTSSDSTSVPLIRDFLVIVTEHWSEVMAGRWRIVLAVSTNANAITQLAELAELASGLLGAQALASRVSEPGRTNAGLRSRLDHLTALVGQAAVKLDSASGLSAQELTWRLLSGLSTRSLRLERTDRADRAAAVTALQRMLRDGTPATADALFSRLEDLVGVWAPQAAVLTQSVIRRAVADFPLTHSARFARAWEMIDRLGSRLRESIRPALRSAAQSLELQRCGERARLVELMRSVGSSAGAVVVTGDPDVGKSALSLRAAEELREQGAAVCSLSLRDLRRTVADVESQWGGHAVDAVLAAGPVGPVRLVLIDGAESVLEGKGEVFRTMSAAAVRAGFGVVAVTRTDGSRQVRDELTHALDLADSDGAAAEYVVGSLTDDERDALVSTFPALARLGSDPRARWLLGRPGLVDVLLRTGVVLDPADLLCEADVFSAVWCGLIRRNEIHTPGAASPHDREEAALSVARRSLGIDTAAPAGTGSAELRSDGVLRVPHNPAFSAGEEFATDLFRDFALCRLFITQGWQPLTVTEAPRWAIRAARLGCQAALLDRSDTHCWARLSASFTEIAAAHGERWREVPYEALLTLGDADAAIRQLWDTFTGDDSAALMTLLRLAETRYISGTVGDAFALAPLVKVIFCERPVIEGRPSSGHRTVRQVIQNLVLAWLRGMADTHALPHPLRREVRDTILDGDPALYDDFAIEALACLGPDIDDRAEARLRQAADDSPGHLNAAVESVHVAVSMSAARPALLLDLAEAYYIKKPSEHERWGGHDLDDGIRDFKHGLTPGFGVPRAAWFYGPFFRLLHTIPMDTIGFLNRMLDHAATVRVQKLANLHGHARDSDTDDLDGVRLDVPGIGDRLYVGDSHVWAWYRATSVGPYACMSALLALERYIDHLLEQLEFPASRLVEVLLRDCHNLAIPALLVGVLTRHPNLTGALLDPFLASPAIWHLEHARVSSDYGLRVRAADADKLTGSERRTQTFQQTVGTMVINARLAGDDDRLAQLQAVGHTLTSTARAQLASSADSDNNEHLAVIETWAEQFRIDNYRMSRDGEHLRIEFERPERLEHVLAPRDAELNTTNTLYGLQNRYSRHNDNPAHWPVDTLAEDLATARAIAETEQPPTGMPWPENPLVAVAAAAVRAHALGLATVTPPDVKWAVDTVMWAADNPHGDDFSYSGSLFSIGADRAAAASAPLLVLAPFDDLGLDPSRVQACLHALATSEFDEVRAIFALGCEPVWTAPCEAHNDTGTEFGVEFDGGPGGAAVVGLDPCRRHAPVWVAATAGLIDSRLGPPDPRTHQRRPDPLAAPVHESLTTVADDELLLNRLRMPLTCVVDARHVPCLDSAVTELWGPLWDAHRRSLAHWWRNDYDHHAHTAHEPIAQRMITIALDGDRGPVAAHITSYATDSDALHKLFDGFATVFTYHDNLRQSLAEFWPWAMEIALDTVADGAAARSQHRGFEYMTAALLPTPNPRSWDPDIDTTLSRCRQNWIQPDALDTLADRWLQLSRREPKAVDAVIKFARSAPVRWQMTTALTWIESIIDGRYDLIANHLWLLEEWVIGLRSTGVTMGEAKSRYHRIIDGLAAAGDRASVRLQQLDE
ncbi:helix-turn-helix domain-containing protein [Actinophytocola xanthii]|uniref:helix-turn-helix domain-containing protein n=1 Tax=Actinophytocola xanthii TaxID=1912961 RepID=UPI000B003277|nr:helix-turn-helix domain-containing protein [Actinophytocola xanthii]